MRVIADLWFVKYPVTTAEEPRRQGKEAARAREREGKSLERQPIFPVSWGAFPGLTNREPEMKVLPSHNYAKRMNDWVVVDWYSQPYK